MNEAADSVYQNPLVTRYAGSAMRELFSPRQRAECWRDLWIALAEAQRELGLDVSDAQLDAMRSTRESVDLDRVAELEAELRHDVMAHLHAFGDEAPSARGILHLRRSAADVWRLTPDDQGI